MHETMIVVHRVGSGVSAGHYGSAVYAPPDEYESGPWSYGVDPETMIGRTLPEGTRLRVTVEVIAEPDTEPEPNPWHTWRQPDWCDACHPTPEPRASW